MPFPIQVLLIHPEAEACEAFTERFADLPNVEIHQALFEHLPPHDCFVTAGNSYGIMTAGIDAAVVNFHGFELMEDIQGRIRDEFLGEQPVGTCFLQPTRNAQFPFIGHAPTMRIPGSIDGTENIYQATLAAFRAVYHHNVKSDEKINSIAFPAMGCGFGGVSFSESARQMATAYNHYLHPPHQLNWETVISRNQAISFDGKKKIIR